MPASGVSPDAVYAKIGRRLLPLLLLCYIVAFLDRVNVGFAKLQMTTALGWSDAVYGFGAGIFFVGYFLFEVPSNVLLERVGARRWIARIMITWALVSGAFAFVDVIPWGPLPAWFGLEPTVFGFYALRLLLGMAEAGFFPGIVLYLTYWYPVPRRARSYARFMTAIAIANVVGAPLSGWIMEAFDGQGGWAGWRWLFVLESVPSLLMGFVVWFRLPDGPAHARWLTEGEAAVVQRDLATDAATVPHQRAETSLRAALTSSVVWRLAFVYFTSAVALYGVNFWMPTIIQELGIPSRAYLTVGLLSMVPWGVAGVGMLWWGARSDRHGERRWHVAGALLCTAAGLLLLMLVEGQIAMSLLALAVVATGVLSAMSTFWSVPTEFLRGTAAAAGIAWINSIGNLGGHFGPDLIGRVRTATGSGQSALLMLAGVATAGALVTLFTVKPVVVTERSTE